MSDALRRGIRTALLAFIGTILSSGVFSAIATAGVVDWSALKKVGISAVAASIIGLLTWAVNALEDKGTIPALLKAPPSAGVNPIPDDAA